MTFSIQQGDLFDPELNFDALAQGVNTYGVMGAGIAVPFKEKYPEMYEDYKALCTKYGGTLAGLLHIWTPEITETLVHEDEDGTEAVMLDFGQTIYNLFSQIAPGRDGNYEYLMKAAIMMRQDAEAQCFDRVGLPWIGCGIAGLEKHNVEHIFKTVLGDSDVDFILIQQQEIM
jgi:O-acetyl-ADP-ribose deacetylase (regulator of RNase III)